MKKEESRIIGLITIWISCFLFFGVNPALGQANATYQVAQHFKQLGQYNEGIYFLQNNQKFGYKPLSEDSTNYLIGKFYYYQKKLSSSIDFLSRVNITSSFYDESRLLYTYQLIYNRQFEQANYSLDSSFGHSSQITKETSLFMSAGLALLQRDIERYDRIRQLNQSGFREIITSQNRLDELKHTVIQQKSKSPALAGIYSTVLPGLGQMYTGNIGRGAMNLLTVGIFGLQAYESYQKDGIKSPRFILFGALFSGFYISNIYGSIIGVKLHQQQINDQIDESILVTMHVPLRYLFN